MKGSRKKEMNYFMKWTRLSKDYDYVYLIWSIWSFFLNKSFIFCKKLLNTNFILLIKKLNKNRYKNKASSWWSTFCVEAHVVNYAKNSILMNLITWPKRGLFFILAFRSCPLFFHKIFSLSLASSCEAIPIFSSLPPHCPSHHYIEDDVGPTIRCMKK